MLYASTSKSDLSITKLTLSSISSHHKLPASLKERFVKIVLDAMRIQQNPNDIPRYMDKESIDLAIKLLADEQLRRAFAQIHEKDDVDRLSPAKAATALKTIGYPAAHQG